MRHKLLLTFIIAITGDLCYGQGNLLLSLNVDECYTCQGNLSNIGLLDSGVRKEIVLDEVHKQDVNSIRDVFSLDNNLPIAYRSSKDFKNSLIEDNYSSVTLTNTDNTKFQRYTLKNDFNPDLVQYINKMSADEASFDFNSDIFGFGTEPLVITGNRAYIFSKFSPVIKRANFITGNVDTFSTLPDDAALTAYTRYFKSETKAKEQMQIVKALNVKFPREIRKIAPQKDGNVWVGVQYTYFAFLNDNKDTFQLKFEAYHEFDRTGEVLKTGLVNSIIDKQHEFYYSLLKNKAVDTNFYNTVLSDMNVMGDTLLISLNKKKYGAGNKGNDDYFLAYYTRNATGDYNLHHYYDKSLPGVYKDYNHYFSNSILTADASYLSLPLVDTIYSIKGNTQPIALGVFKEKQFTGSPLNYSYTVQQIESGPTTLSVMYYDNISKQVKVVRYDIQKKATDAVYSVSDPAIMRAKFIQLDSFDPYYLWYLSGNSQLTRTRLK